MINTKYLLLASVCVLLNGNAQASEVKNLTFDYSGSPLVNTHTYTTPTPMELKPISSLDNAVKLAAVCAITGGGCSGMSFGSSGNSMDLDKNSQCTDEGFVKVCPSGYVKDDNNLCPHNKSYFKCRICSHECASGTLKACNNQQIQTETSTNDCLETCYQCRDKTCAEGGYAASLTSCQNGTAFSFANKTCYKDVSDKTCEDGGYKSDVPTNNVCTAVTYCNKICHKDCYQPACEEGGYKSAVPANNVCTDVTYYGRTCKTDCKQPTCEDGGYKSGVPTNQVCTPVSYYGRTCYQNCYQPQCTAGGYLDAQPSGQFCTAETYFGRTCYKQCCDAATYKYDESNCSGDTKLAGNSCGGKYDACETICVSGYKYGTFDKDTSKCQMAINTLKETGLLDLQEDLYCGPRQNFYMTMCHTTPQKYKIRGNGHTITFDDESGVYIGWLQCGGTGYEPDKSDYIFEIENLKIIHDNSAWNHCYDHAGAVIKASNSKITNVDITSYIPALGVTNRTLELYGNNHIKMLDDGSEYAKESHVGADFTLYGNLDLVLPYSKDDNRVKYYGQMVVKPGAVLNVKGGGGHLRVFKGGKVNACLYSQTARLSLMWNSDNNKEDVKMTTYFFDYEQNDSVTVVPDLCSSDIFSGDFWK